MYIVNDIVYGGKPAEPILIEKIKCLPDMQMLITFTSGETRLFDASVLTGEVYEALGDDSIFKSARLDHGIVTWNGGEIDCSPEFMYDHSFEYRETAG